MTEFHPLKVAVLGSCATRDVFNRTFNPDYKQHFECVALADKVSLISLMAEPVDVSEEDFSDLEPRDQGLLTSEFRRSFLIEIQEKKPDYLVLDLWAEIMFGYAEFRGSRISRNFWTTLKTDLYKREETVEHVMHQNIPTYLREWKPAVDNFFAFMNEYLPDTMVVLHSPRNASQWIDKDGAVHKFDPFYSRLNPNWQILDEYILEHYVTRSISIMGPDTSSFEEHPWGKYHVHYTFDYHEKFLNELRDIAWRDGTDLPVLS